MTTRWWGGAGVLVVAALVLAGLSRLSAQTPVATLGVEGRSNAFVTSTAIGQFVAMTWAATVPDGATDIYAVVSTNGGARLSAPVRVNAVAGQARVNGEQPPRVALVPRKGTTAEIVVVWTARESSGTRLLAARSRDGGRSFAATEVVAGSEAAGNRGWQATAVTSAGNVLALWLDHRDTVASGAGHVHGAAQEHAPREDGVARAQRSQIFAGSLDGTIAAQSLARGVCYCCKTSLAAGPGGSVVAAWRHVYPGNQRDIAFSASRDGGRTFSTPVRVSEDGWQVDGCPENGPALAVDNGRVHVAWPSMVKERGGEALKLFHASTIDGKTFTRRTALPVVGFAYHPQIAVHGGAPLVVWEETSPRGRRIKLWRGGKAEDLGAGTHPTIAITAGHAVIAWSQRAGAVERIAVRRVAF